jgi:hypothetical protein
MISLLTSSVVDLGLCPSQVKQLTKTANMANKKYCLIWLTLSGGDIVFVQIWCNYRYNYIYVHMCIMLGIVFANNNNLKTRFPSSFTQKMLLFLHTDSIFYKLRLQDHWGSKCLHTNVGCNEIELINCILKHQEGKCNCVLHEIYLWNGDLMLYK